MTKHLLVLRSNLKSIPVSSIDGEEIDLMYVRILIEDKKLIKKQRT